MFVINKSVGEFVHNTKTLEESGSSFQRFDPLVILGVLTEKEAYLYSLYKSKLLRDYGVALN